MARRSEKANRRPRTTTPKGHLGLWVALALIVLVAGYLAVLDNSRPHVTGDALSLSTLVDLAEKGRIVDAQVLDFDSYVVGHYVRSDHVTATYNSPYLRTYNSDLVKLLLDNRVPTTIDQQTGKSLAALASYLLPSLILILLFGYLIVSYRRGSGVFGVRSGAHRVAPDSGTVTFADVAGQEAAITELREVTQFLRNPAQFAVVGAKIPRGILLYGPPGCGKTLLARALAGESGANFYSISGSDFVEVFVGVGAARVRDLFRSARENTPALVFIDEIDAVGRARSGADLPDSQGEQAQALNQILTELDGFSTSEGILVIGATNRPDILDPALLRPGRFDRSVGLERPDEAGRLAILRLHAKLMPFADDVDLAVVARRAVGLTGADLASVMNEGALLAARANKTAVSQEELLEAVQRILQAPERQRRLSMRERGIGRRFTSGERVTFADVAGMEGVVEELAEVKEYLSDQERFARMGAAVPRGILLSGPPGCGKTLLARAVAGEANAAFFSVAATEFVEVFAGQGSARVRELFGQARAAPPAIIFLDEIDAIGGHRSPSAAAGHREVENTLNQVLVEMDGFEARGGVIVMAATNRIDLLDSALTRSGRFDRRISIDPPNRASRLAILTLHAKGKPLAADVDLAAIARQTSGFSGADLAGTLNEAALLAARRGLDTIPLGTVREAMDRTLMGVASKAEIMTPAERRLVAYHEAGHAIVGRALPGAGSVRKLTIVRRSHTLGQTLIDNEDRVTHSRSTFIDEIAATMAGRVAEHLAIGEVSSAAGNDLERATQQARRMVSELGMSEALGPIVYGGDATRFPDAVVQLIDSEVRAVLDEASARARLVLMQNRDGLDRVAAALLENETLDADELERVLTGAPAPTAPPARPAPPIARELERPAPA